MSFMEILSEAGQRIIGNILMGKALGMAKA